MKPPNTFAFLWCFTLVFCGTSLWLFAEAFMPFVLHPFSRVVKFQNSRLLVASLVAWLTDVFAMLHGSLTIFALRYQVKVVGCTET